VDCDTLGIVCVRPSAPSTILAQEVGWTQIFIPGGMDCTDKDREDGETESETAHDVGTRCQEGLRQERQQRWGSNLGSGEVQGA